MKALLLSLPVVLFLAALPVFSQEETAHHRAVYKQINDQEKDFTKVTCTYLDEPLTFALTAWLDSKGAVRKIISKTDEDGAGVEEYYLEKERPLFVYSTYYKNHLSKKPELVESRLYFKEDQLIRWLTTDKESPVFHAEDYAAESERLRLNCRAFLAAIRDQQSSKKKP